MTKPIILTFVGAYLPGYKAGGPLRTTANIVEHLSDEFDFWIITRDRDLGDGSPYPEILPDQWQRLGNAMVYYLSPENCTVKKMAVLIGGTHHDVMYLNSFFSPTFTIKPLLARRLGWLPKKPVVVAPRGEFSPGAFKIKHLKKVAFVQIAKIFRLYNNVAWQASSDYEAEDIARCFGANRKDVHVAVNLPNRAGPNVPVDTPNTTECDGADLRIVFLSRISAKKNLDYALKALRYIAANVRFDIYGPTEDANYWHGCKKLIKELPANVSVNYLGSAKSDQVASIFSRYDLFFFPTRGENYGHVIAEALSVGTPVLLSDQTPWRNLEADRMGWDIPLDDPDRFAGIIDELSATTPEERLAVREHIRRQTSDRLSDPKIFQANRALFRRVA